MHHAPDKNGQRGSYRKIGAHGKGQRTHAEQLHCDNQEHSQQHQSPRQPLVQNSVDDGGHQSGLRRRRLLRADALNPLDFNLLGLRVVQILALGQHGRTDSIKHGVGLALIFVAGGFNLHADWRIVDVEIRRHRAVLRQPLVHQNQRKTDKENRGHYTDKLHQLLPHRSSPDQVAGFQVL